MSELTVTNRNFENEVLHADMPVLLDFWATWCGPCQMLSPIVAEIAAEYDGKIKVGRVNVDEEPELAGAFRITGIPTVVVMKNGRVTASAVGYRPKEDIVKLLNR